MNKSTVIIALVLLLITAMPLCIARGPQGPRSDDFVDAPYTTIPPEETPTERLAEALATAPPGRYGEIHLTDAETDTLDEVIYQPRQFSTAERVQSAEPTEMQYIAIGTALSGPNILPLEVVFFSQEGENDNVWGTIGGHVFCYPYIWEGEAG